MTVLEVIQKSSEFLTGKGIPSPRLEVEWILAHVLSMPRLHLYLNFNKELAGDELDRVRAMVMRRGKREPLQHILGTIPFCGIELAVDRNALIPRPETELLAELGWQFLQKTRQGVGTLRALDFGTGTGCLAIALALHAPCEVWALDKSKAALGLAGRNIAALKLEHRIHLVLGENFSNLPRDVQFDLVISNPPYIPTEEIPHLEPEVREHDPREALDGGKDGLDYFRLLAAHAAQVLTADGKLMAEFGDGQSPAIAEIYSRHGWTIEAFKADDTGRARIVIALPRKS